MDEWYQQGTWKDPRQHSSEDEQLEGENKKDAVIKNALIAKEEGAKVKHLQVPRPLLDRRLPYFAAGAAMYQS